MRLGVIIGLVMVAFSAHGQDVILDWNRQTNLAIQAELVDPFSATRTLALQSVAVLDTLKAISGERGLLAHLSAPAGLDAETAAAAAGHAMLVQLFPRQQRALDATLAVSLAKRPAGAARDQAVIFGGRMAQAIFLARANDVGPQPPQAPARTGPGEWQPTPPAFLPPLLPQWAGVKPFVLESPEQFRPPGPPAIGTARFREALRMVVSLGAARSDTRTQDQSEIARYWSDGLGTYAPAGHWNAIAAVVVAPSHLGLLAEAELFAELNIAMADACVAMVDAKYAYGFWRPITAIRAGVAGVAAIADWRPLLETPNHPSYVSGHSSFSGAAAAVLTAWFGDRAFRIGSESLPGVRRQFTSFTQAAEEAAASRVYGGIHFTFDSDDGLVTGRKVGDWTLAAFKGVALRRPGG